MTETGDAGARARTRWDVALSFAGAQRDYVGQVAAVLKARGVRCFYDADEQVRLWGKHLAEELPAIYAQESAVVVVFISADYAGREWTRLERRAAFSRAVAEAGVYVLPARFDNSELPGLLPDVVSIDLRQYTPVAICPAWWRKSSPTSVSACHPRWPGAAGSGRRELSRSRRRICGGSECARRSGCQGFPRGAAGVRAAGH